VNEWTPIIVALLAALGGTAAGFAALRKSGAEAGKASAEAADSIVGSAGEVVKLLRDQMAEMAKREDARDDRLLSLERTVGSWEGWAERVLDVLDRAVALLGEEHRAKLREDVQEVKASRPIRHRRPASDGARPKASKEPPTG